METNTNEEQWERVDLNKLKEEAKQERQTKGPKDLLTEQETAEFESMTEGQQADYMAEQSEYEPN
jgi:hypothetical protein